MATIVRSCTRNILRNLCSHKFNNNRVLFISTSKKNKDTAHVAENVIKAPIDFSKPEENKNWVSYGFAYDTKENDESAFHSLMFISVSVCMVIGGAFILYFPDYQDRDWAQREAFLELRRREAEGLPLIDANYIPIENLEIPADEDIGEDAIII